MTIKVYKFGLLDPVSGWDQTAIDVLFLRNKLWNNLVAMEHEKRQAYRNLLLDSDTELAAMQARLDAIEVEKASLITSKKALRAKARSRQVDTAEIDLEIKKLLDERKALGGQTKDLRERVKIEVKPLAAEIDKQRYEKTKQLSKESGLWWCNSRTVIAAYELGRLRAMREKNELRFHGFDGAGKYAVCRTGGFSLDDVCTQNGRDYIICGDWNIAHKEIDLKNWRGNKKNSGFLPEERAWLDQLFERGDWLDAFRIINPEAEQYTWWSNRGQAWAKNVGWRIDYQIISAALKDKVIATSIFKDERFSDHAPLILDYDLSI